MSYEEALRIASRDERFKATVYAMNSLLICKGVYTHQEFQQVFTEWVEKEQKKNAQRRMLLPRFPTLPTLSKDFSPRWITARWALAAVFALVAASAFAIAFWDFGSWWFLLLHVHMLSVNMPSV